MRIGPKVAKTCSCKKIEIERERERAIKKESDFLFDSVLFFDSI